MRLRRLGAGKAFASAIDRLRGRGFVVAISFQAPSMIYDRCSLVPIGFQGTSPDVTH